jgi:hypothetical protein
MKNTAKFKNITDETLTVIGVGIVEAGETVELPEDFHNSNFQRITKEIKEIKDKEIKTNKNKDL